MALMPEYLQGLPEELESLAEQLERDILEDAARRIAKTGQITDTAAYQLARVKEMGASREYITKRLAEFTKMSEEVIERLIFDAAQTDSEFYEEFYRKLGKDYTPFEYNEYLQQMTRACINQTMGELTNLTQSMGFAMRASDGRTYFTPTATAYQRTMDEAEMLVASGGVDHQTAVRRATAKLTASGLQFVDYATGHRNHVDVAVRRALLTGIGQMTGKIAESNAAQLDTDVVETTAHQGARPDHSVWQGRWFSLHGEDKRYPLLSRETGYGTVTGLKGANCRHDFFPVVPGVSQPSYTDEQLRKMDEPVTVNGVEMPYYEAEQKQRAMERAIRKTKRELICAEASGDEERFKEKSILLRRQRQAYKEFSRDANIPMRGDRLGVGGFGRSLGAKSGWIGKNNTTYKVFSIGEVSGKHSQNFTPFLNSLDKSQNNSIIKYGYERSVVQLVREEFDATFKEMTEKFGNITTIRSIEVLDDKSSDSSLYEIHSGTLRIRYANKKECLKTLQSKITENNRNKEWSTGHSRHIFRHEIGHAIVAEHEKSDPLWNDKLNKIKDIYLSMPELSADVDICKVTSFKVSRYAASNLDDFIAECIAESMVKKCKPTAKKVVSIILGGDIDDIRV